MKVVVVALGAVVTVVGLLLAADLDEGGLVGAIVLIVVSLAPYVAYLIWLRVRWLAAVAGVAMVVTTAGFTVAGHVDDSSTAALAFLVPVQVNTIVIAGALIVQQWIRRPLRS